MSLWTLIPPSDEVLIQRLFSNGELGGYWPADPAYVYEDSAGTTLASANGVVGYRTDVALGKHAVQATTGNKPYLRLTPTTNKPWYDSNTSIGALTATFSGALGSACTIATATPEGVSISENQTVGTTYNITPPFDYNSDVLIINRALTAAERALVMRVMQRSVPRLSFKAAVTFNDLSEWSDTTDCSVSGGKLTITPVPNGTWRFPVSNVVFNFIAGCGYVIKWRSLAPSGLAGIGIYGVVSIDSKLYPGVYLQTYFSPINQSKRGQFKAPYPAVFDMYELYEIL